MRIPIRKFHRLVILFALIIYCITAYNGHGYLQEDEHYQIIEFAQLKAGLNHPQDMPWEYQAKMRSGAQPFIAYCFFKCCYWLNVTNPYTLAFLLRLTTAFLAIFVITKFVKASLGRIHPKYQKLYIFCSYLLWFLPFVNVRFSSETWSGLFFLWGLAVFFNKKNNSQYFTIGILLGLTYLFRFQSGILSVAFLCWLFFIQKENFKNILKIITGGMAVFFVGILFDYWLYGSFTFSCRNYISSNAAIMPQVIEKFGYSPWYDYLLSIVYRPSLLLGIPIFLSMLYLIIFDIKNLFSWLIIAFLLVHALIPHKEVRYLYPLINYAAIVFFLALQSAEKKIFYKTKIIIPGNLLITTLILFFIVNTIALTGVISRAADGRVAISRYIHSNYSNKSLKIVYSRWSDYFTPEIPANFYKQKNIELVQLDSIAQFNTTLIDSSKINFLVIRRGVDVEQNNYHGNLLIKFGYKKQMQSLPQWIEQLGIPAKLIFETEILDLYRKQ